MKELKLIVFIVFLINITTFSYGGVFLEDNFDTYSNENDIDTVWFDVESAVKLETEGCRNGKCISVDYSSTGTSPHQINIDPYPGGVFSEGYIRFYFKRTGSGTARIKFFKLSGRTSESGYSNITYEWSIGNVLSQYFSGGINGGDNNCTYHYSGGGSFTCGADYNLTSNSFEVPYNEWHSFEAYTKLNTDGHSDGEVKIWIDGELRCHTTRMNMRSSNIPRDYALLRFGDSGYELSGNIKIWYDDLVISDTRIGQLNQEENISPPKGLIIPPPPTQESQETTIFTDDFENGNCSKWDNVEDDISVSTINPINGNYSLRMHHVAGSSNSDFIGKGFSDNEIFTELYRQRVNEAIVGCKVAFSTDNFPLGATTKIMQLESWPSNNWPSTEDKSFQAIVEVYGPSLYEKQIVVTLKREGWDFYTQFQTEDPILISPNTIYDIKLRIKLDTPYTAQNGEIQLWINGNLKLESTNENFILASRGSDLPHGLNFFILGGYSGSPGSPDTKFQYWDDAFISIVE